MPRRHFSPGASLLGAPDATRSHASRHRPGATSRSLPEDRARRESLLRWAHAPRSRQSPGRYRPRDRYDAGARRGDGRRPAGPRLLAAFAFALGFGALLLLHRRLRARFSSSPCWRSSRTIRSTSRPIGMVLPATGALFSAAEQRRTPWAIGTAAVLLTVGSAFRLFVTDLRRRAAGLHFRDRARSGGGGHRPRRGRAPHPRGPRAARPRSPTLTAAEQAHAADARMQSRADADRPRPARHDRAHALGRLPACGGCGRGDGCHDIPRRSRPGARGIVRGSARAPPHGQGAAGRSARRTGAGAR